MSRNLLLTLMFDGTRYHGSQVQQNALSVCQVVQDAVEKVLGVREDIIACSRTDTGVHARCFCVNLHTSHPIPDTRVCAAMNFHLPWDIRAADCREVPEDFHARYDARGKRYEYLIWNAPYENPFYKDKALYYRWKLDEGLLDTACRDYLGTHDFTSFCSLNTKVVDKVRTVTDCSVTRDGDFVRFTVSGDGFLHNMVRIMVGTLLRIAERKLPGDAIPGILRARNRDAAGYTAPACGLYLDEVFYP